MNRREFLQATAAAAIAATLPIPASVAAGDSIRVFRLNDEEWWAGRSLAEVVACASKVSGLPAEEVACDPAELSDDDMLVHDFHLNQYELEDDEDDVITFAEQLDRLKVAGQEFPCPFATTDW